MKNLRITATGKVRENVDNAEAAALIIAGEAREVPASYGLIGNRDPQLATIENRDPVTAPKK